MADAQTDEQPYRLAGSEAMQAWRDSTPAISDIVAPADKSIAGLTSDLASVQRRKIVSDSAITSEADKRLAADRAQMAKAFEAEGVAAGEQLKPWDAEKEHKRFESDPIAGFGSIGGLFAMVASAFTKAPMENAINGMAGAINSIKQGDEAAYERAHQAWQENTKLALERFKTQHELYQDATALMSTDVAVGEAKLHNAAVRFGDTQTLMLLEHGMSKELFELQESRARAASMTQDLVERTTEKTLRDKAYEAGLKDLPQTGNPAVDAAHKLALFTRTHALEKATPQQALMGQFFLENPKATAEEAADFADKHGIIRQYGLAGAASSITRQEAQAVEEELKKDPSMSRTDAIAKVKAASKGAGVKLDDSTLDEMADQAIAGDTSVFTNLGRGAQGGENVIRLRARIAQKLAEKGRTGKDQALAAAEYGGTKAALRTAATREATIGQAAFEAKKFMTIAREASDNVPRTSVVPFNKMVQMVEAATGDPALKRFVVANNSLVNQYVRAISPTGVPTDIVRKHAYDMLATADGPKAYNAVLDIMNNEMDAAITSPAKMRDYIMGSGAAPTTAPEGMSGGAPPYEGNIIKYDKEGNRIK